MNTTLNLKAPKKAIHFEVSANSMEDGTKRSISKGDILATVELPKRQWRSEFKKGSVLIILDRALGTILREVTNYSAESNEITCRCWNQSEGQPDFKLNIDSIMGIYYIDTISRRYC